MPPFTQQFMPTVQSQQATPKRTEYGGEAGLWVKLAFPASPPDGSAPLLPTFYTFSTFCIGPFWIHGQRHRDPRTSTAVAPTMMRQPGVPDHEIPGPHWNFDNVVPGDVNWSVNERLIMGA
jgi:hypothetical protein